MKFVLAGYGGRGDIEPSVVVGRELLRRGHDVCMAVPPNLVGFTEAAGLAAVAYGLDSQAILDAQRKYWTWYFRTPWKLEELNRMGREIEEFATRCWGEMTPTLASVAEGADLLMTGLIFEQPAANVAEYYDIPLATLHFFPVRAHGQLLPFLPSPLTRTV
ncbi:MAG: glycosyl transferase family 1, partial [Mycobacterium sp.]